MSSNATSDAFAKDERGISTSPVRWQQMVRVVTNKNNKHVPYLASKHTRPGAVARASSMQACPNLKSTSSIRSLPGTTETRIPIGFCRMGAISASDCRIRK